MLILLRTLRQILAPVNILIDNMAVARVAAARAAGSRRLYKNMPASWKEIAENLQARAVPTVVTWVPSQ